MRRSPHLSFLGELHTHPYDSLREVNAVKGWEFSDEDREWWPESEDDETSVWRLYDAGELPLWLVLAVAPLQRVHDTEGAKPITARENVWTFDVGELRFWLHAELGDRDAAGTIQFEKDVVLNMTAPFSNLAGDRLFF